MAHVIDTAVATLAEASQQLLGGALGTRQPEAVARITMQLTECGVPAALAAALALPPSATGAVGLEFVIQQYLDRVNNKLPTVARIALWCGLVAAAYTCEPKLPCKRCLLRVFVVSAAAPAARTPMFLEQDSAVRAAGGLQHPRRPALMAAAHAAAGFASTVELLRAPRSTDKNAQPLHDSVVKVPLHHTAFEHSQLLITEADSAHTQHMRDDATGFRVAGQ